MTQSWISRSLGFAIYAYRRLISPLLRPRCRFEPSCSEYAAMAISAHGARKGVTLACLRLLKCHPLHPGGIDPVPRVYRMSYRLHKPAVPGKNHDA